MSRDLAHRPGTRGSVHSRISILEYSYTLNREFETESICSSGGGVIGCRTIRERLMNITSLLCNAEFDFGTTELLTRAFDQAWEIAKAGGGPHVDSELAPATRLVLATRIIDMVLQGERDPDRLIDGALDVLSGIAPSQTVEKARIRARSKGLLPLQQRPSRTSKK